MCYCQQISDIEAIFMWVPTEQINAYYKYKDWTILKSK